MRNFTHFFKHKNTALKSNVLIILAIGRTGLDLLPMESDGAERNPEIDGS